MNDAGGLAELVGVHLRAEHVFQVLVLEHGRGHADVGPHEFLGSVDLGGHRHAVRARVDAHQQVDLGVVQQPLGLVDGDVGLGLRVGLDGDDLVAFDAALLVDHVDGDLVADGCGLGAAGGERAGLVVDGADLDVGCGRGLRSQQGRDEVRRRCWPARGVSCGLLLGGRGQRRALSASCSRVRGRSVGGARAICQPRRCDTGCRRGSSDHEMLDRDAPAVHLVLEALHGRAAEVPGEAGAGSAAAHDLVGRNG